MKNNSDINLQKETFNVLLFDEIIRRISPRLNVSQPQFEDESERTIKRPAMYQIPQEDIKLSLDHRYRYFL